MGGASCEKIWSKKRLITTCKQVPCREPECLTRPLINEDVIPAQQSRRRRGSDAYEDHPRSQRHVQRQGCHPTPEQSQGNHRLALMQASISLVEQVIGQQSTHSTCAANLLDVCLWGLWQTVVDDDSHVSTTEESSVISTPGDTWQHVATRGGRTSCPAPCQRQSWLL